MTREEYINDIFSTYDLVSVLSDKNDCRVLRIRHKTMGQDLVLRSYASEIKAYEILVNIECENLPVVYDSVTLDDGQIVLEEYIDGVTVSEMLESGKYRYFSARKVVRSVCNALTVLHDRKLVHRDVKPENIVISNEGRVVLIDLNTTRKISQVAGKDTVIMGTVGYAPPEQLGVAQSDERTDIYAVGVLLNVMVTGKHPTEEIAKGKAGRIVRKCTNVSPDERYQSAQKLINAL